MRSFSEDFIGRDTSRDSDIARSETLAYLAYSPISA